MNKKYKRIFLAALLMGTVSWLRADVGVSSHTAPGRPSPAVDPWQQRIRLTSDQTAKFHAAMEAHQTALRTLQQQMRDQMQKMRDLVQNKADDKDILTSLNALKSSRKAMQDENEKFDDNLAGFLSPAQRTVWGGMMGPGMMGPGMMGPGMMGPGMMGPGMMGPGMGRPQPQTPVSGGAAMGQKGQPSPPPPASSNQK